MVCVCVSHTMIECVCVSSKYFTWVTFLKHNYGICKWLMWMATDPTQQQQDKDCMRRRANRTQNKSAFQMRQMRLDWLEREGCCEVLFVVVVVVVVRTGCFSYVPHPAYSPSGKLVNIFPLPLSLALSFSFTTGNWVSFTYFFLFLLRLSPLLSISGRPASIVPAASHYHAAQPQRMTFRSS